MKLKEALHKYETMKEKSEKEIIRIAEKHTKNAKAIISKILKYLEELNKKEIPKNVDPRLAKIVKMERETYIRALQNMLEKIQDIKDIEKILPEISRLHIAHGRHLLLIFEKDVYRINALLKDLSNEYTAYLSALKTLQFPEIETKRLLKEIEDLRKHIDEQELLLKQFIESLHNLEVEKEQLEKLPEFSILKENEEKLKREILSRELSARSKLSKLQKPIKRMRLPDKHANEFLKNSGYALEHPQAFLEVLEKVEGKLDKKYKKTSEWAKRNIVKEAQTIKELKEELTNVERKLAHFKSKEESIQRALEELKQKIKQREEKIKVLKEELQNLEKKLKESISELERIVGDKIDVEL
ncbi:hypothetical protein EP1X_08165 [Thermococcus sp. EP1]|uniref:hypothetical protein n=1 Tax=Thermococcus sp. EP1 TaxID=1591054 RepID=UPI0006DB76C8|nr:hypothetical protein [Thermococcus sp. EP1]KPU62536.1 hypothetical protein EP1X_08165 [Thermococcus sp. EP1]